MLWRLLLGIASPPSDGVFLSLCAIMAFCAGGVKTVIHRSAKTNWKDVLAGAMASSLVGFGVGSGLLYAWGPDKTLLIFPCVSVCSWVGVALLDLAGDWAMRRIKADIRDREPPDDPK